MMLGLILYCARSSIAALMHVYSACAWEVFFSVSLGGKLCASLLVYAAENDNPVFVFSCTSLKQSSRRTAVAIVVVAAAVAFADRAP